MEGKKRCPIERDTRLEVIRAKVRETTRRARAAGEEGSAPESGVKR